MAATQQLLCLALLSCAVAVLAAPPPAALDLPKFVKAHIVKNATTQCPVKNVEFKKSEFDADKVGELANVMTSANLTEECLNDATGLLTCQDDGSLRIKEGCCTIACAAAIDKTIKTGCFRELSKAICNDTGASQFQVGLANAAARCADFRVTSCEDVLAEAKKGAKANATTSAADEPKAAAGGSTSRDAPAAAAPAADKPKNSAGAAAATLLPLAGAATALLLAALH